MDLQPLGSRDLPPDWLLSLAFPVRFSKHRLALVSSLVGEQNLVMQ